MKRHLNIAIIALVLITVAVLAYRKATHRLASSKILMTAESVPATKGKSATASTSDPTVEVEDRSLDLPSEEKAEVLHDLGFNAPSIPREGDIEGLKALYKIHYGLELEELHRDATGKYNLTVTTSVPSKMEPALAPKYAENYFSRKKAVLDELNHGKAILLTKQDETNLVEFRRRWGD